MSSSSDSDLEYGQSLVSGPININKETQLYQKLVGLILSGKTDEYDIQCQTGKKTTSSGKEVDVIKDAMISIVGEKPVSLKDLISKVNHSHYQFNQQLENDYANFIFSNSNIKPKAPVSGKAPSMSERIGILALDENTPTPHQDIDAYFKNSSQPILVGKVKHKTNGEKSYSDIHWVAKDLNSKTGYSVKALDKKNPRDKALKDQAKDFFPDEVGNLQKLTLSKLKSQEQVLNDFCNDIIKRSYDVHYLNIEGDNSPESIIDSHFKKGSFEPMIISNWDVDEQGKKVHQGYQLAMRDDSLDKGYKIRNIDKTDERLNSTLEPLKKLPNADDGLQKVHNKAINNALNIYEPDIAEKISKNTDIYHASPATKVALNIYTGEEFKPLNSFLRGGDISYKGISNSPEEALKELMVHSGILNAGLNAWSPTPKPITITKRMETRFDENVHLYRESGGQRKPVAPIHLLNAESTPDWKDKVVPDILNDKKDAFVLIKNGDTTNLAINENNEIKIIDLQKCSELADKQAEISKINEQLKTIDSQSNKGKSSDVLSKIISKTKDKSKKEKNSLLSKREQMIQDLSSEKEKNNIPTAFDLEKLKGLQKKCTDLNFPTGGEEGKLSNKEIMNVLPALNGSTNRTNDTTIAIMDIKGFISTSKDELPEVGIEGEIIIQVEAQAIDTRPVSQVTEENEALVLPGQFLYSPIDDPSDDLKNEADKLSKKLGGKEVPILNAKAVRVLDSDNYLKMEDVIAAKTPTVSNTNTTDNVGLELSDGDEVLDMEIDLDSKHDTLSLSEESIDAPNPTLSEKTQKDEKPSFPSSDKGKEPDVPSLPSTGNDYRSRMSDEIAQSAALNTEGISSSSEIEIKSEKISQEAQDKDNFIGSNEPGIEALNLPADLKYQSISKPDLKQSEFSEVEGKQMSTPSPSGSQFDFSNMDSKQLTQDAAKAMANDLMLNNLNKFQQIKPEDLEDLAWSKKPKDDKGNKRDLQDGEPGYILNSMSQDFNQLSIKVQSDILKASSLEDARSITSFYTQVMDESIKNNDLQSAQALLSGLNKSPLQRIHGYILDEESTQSLNRASELFSSAGNSKNLRKHMNELEDSSTPYIPYLGTHQTDLTMLEETISNKVTQAEELGKEYTDQQQKSDRLAGTKTTLESISKQQNALQIKSLNPQSNISSELSSNKYQEENLYDISVAKVPRPINPQKDSLQDIHNKLTGVVRHSDEMTGEKTLVNTGEKPEVIRVTGNKDDNQLNSVKMIEEAVKSRLKSGKLSKEDKNIAKDILSETKSKIAELDPNVKVKETKKEKSSKSELTSQNKKGKSPTKRLGKAVRDNPAVATGAAVGGAVAGIGGAVVGGTTGYAVQEKAKKETGKESNKEKQVAQKEKTKSSLPSKLLKSGSNIQKTINKNHNVNMMPVGKVAGALFVGSVASDPNARKLSDIPIHRAINPFSLLKGASTSLSFLSAAGVDKLLSKEIASNSDDPSSMLAKVVKAPLALTTGLIQAVCLPVDHLGDMIDNLSDKTQTKEKEIEPNIPDNKVEENKDVEINLVGKKDKTITDKLDLSTDSPQMEGSESELTQDTASVIEKDSDQLIQTEGSELDSSETLDTQTQSQSIDLDDLDFQNKDIQNLAEQILNDDYKLKDLDPMMDTLKNNKSELNNDDIDKFDQLLNNIMKNDDMSGQTKMKANYVQLTLGEMKATVEAIPDQTEKMDIDAKSKVLEIAVATDKSDQSLQDKMSDHKDLIELVNFHNSLGENGDNKYQLQGSENQAKLCSVIKSTMSESIFVSEIESELKGDLKDFQEKNNISGEEVDRGFDVSSVLSEDEPTSDLLSSFKQSLEEMKADKAEQKDSPKPEPKAEQDSGRKMKM